MPDFIFTTSELLSHRSAPGATHYADAQAEWLTDNINNRMDISRPKGTTGLLDSTEGASTTQYVAPQSTAGADVAASSVADVQLVGDASRPDYRARDDGPTYIVEHLEQVDADGKRMSPWCKCEYIL